jgi:LmbE family N-acetylglucosaminyl deacetylase
VLERLDVQAFQWPFAERKNPSILCLGAHCDDIEIGCGGTILRLLTNFRGCHVDWFVFGSSPARRREALEGARLFLKNAAKKRVVVRSYRDAFFPYEGARIKQEFERLKRTVEPDLIFTHCRGDLHQDHRVINELTWNTFRDHPILEYEIPKYDGDLGSPNVFVPLSETLRRDKIGYLQEAYSSQRSKDWFTESTFQGLMRLRGVESRSATGFAEGFYARKIVL